MHWPSGVALSHTKAVPTVGLPVTNGELVVADAPAEYHSLGELEGRILHELGLGIDGQRDGVPAGTPRWRRR